MIIRFATSCSDDIYSSILQISQEYMGNGSIGLHVTHCTEDGAEIKLKTAKVMQITVRGV
jgi:hypothetical protein